MDIKLLEVMNEALNKCIPQKTIKLRNIDKKFITSELEQLDRKRKREFKKHSKISKISGSQRKLPEIIQ